MDDWKLYHGSANPDPRAKTSWWEKHDGASILLGLVIIVVVSVVLAYLPPILEFFLP